MPIKMQTTFAPLQRSVLGVVSRTWSTTLGQVLLSEVYREGDDHAAAEEH